MARIKTKQITVKEFNDLCAVAADRGSFYDRYKASFASVPETNKEDGSE